APGIWQVSFTFTYTLYVNKGGNFAQGKLDVFSRPPKQFAWYAASTINRPDKTTNSPGGIAFSFEETILQVPQLDALARWRPTLTMRRFNGFATGTFTKMTATFLRPIPVAQRGGVIAT